MSSAFRLSDLIASVGDRSKSELKEKAGLNEAGQREVTFAAI